MDGVHDIGGMHGFGPVPIEVDEPLFHEAWEGRVWAMWSAIGATTVDRFRFTIEQMPPAAYLASSYLRAVAVGDRAPGVRARPADRLGPTVGPGAPLSGPGCLGRTFPKRRLRPGPQCRDPGHTRVPRYLRRQVGRVEGVACVWPNPGDSAESGTYGDPELVYTVAFNGGDLFGPGADHTVTADIPDSDLEQP